MSLEHNSSQKWRANYLSEFLVKPEKEERTSASPPLDIYLSTAGPESLQSHRFRILGPFYTATTSARYGKFQLLFLILV